MFLIFVGFVVNFYFLVFVSVREEHNLVGLSIILPLGLKILEPLFGGAPLSPEIYFLNDLTALFSNISQIRSS